MAFCGPDVKIVGIEGGVGWATILHSKFKSNVSGTDQVYVTDRVDNYTFPPGGIGTTSGGLTGDDGGDTGDDVVGAWYIEPST